MSSISGRTIWVHDRTRIADRLREEPALHLYALGDLDDFFFPHTIWYALEVEGALRQIALLYTGTSLPCLQALAPESEVGEMRSLVRAMAPLLPRRLYVHATPGVVEELAEAYELSPHGLHRKMVLRDRGCLDGVDTSRAAALGPADRAEIDALYAAAYPGNWFDARMLETGRYMGVREGGRLVSIAGIHVYSPVHRVAALGNVTTHPDHRGRGLAGIVTAALCRVLLDDCDVIGLNVLADNRAAIGVYERLGFAIVASYDEVSAELRI